MRIPNEKNIDPSLFAQQAMDAMGADGGIDVSKMETAVCTLLLSGGGLDVVGGKARGTGNVIPAQDKPEIEAADVPENENAVDVAKLVMLLKLVTDEMQASEARKRIENQKSEIESRTKERMADIEKSLKEMDKAAAANKRSKIFGWIGVALAAVVAIAACVVTGGLALGPVVGALLAIGFQVANATGAMEKLTEKLAKGLEKLGMSERASKILASVIIAVGEIAISIAAGVGADKIAASCSKLRTMKQVVAAVADLASTTEKVVKGVSITASSAMAISGLGLQADSTVKNFEAGIAGAEATRSEAVLKRLRQMLEESQEELEEILQMLMQGPEAIARLLETDIESLEAIAHNIGQMA